MNILTAEKICKAYPIFSSEWCRIGRWFGLPFKPSTAHQVLTNIDFAIRKGEAIGIVGQNGAGKSTLLKIINGTLQPSSGKLHVNGRISAILELGMGFSSELTGRQNAIHACGLMGYSQQETLFYIQQIQTFAELGVYFDQPVRTYSSGMHMRLAFSVATAHRPEILIVDEALSVGDAYFQHKSFNRIREFRDQGTTILFVSHDRSAIQNLCDRAILLKKGELIKDGSPEEIFDYYNALIAEKNIDTVKVNALNDGRLQTVSGTGEALIDDIAMYNNRGLQSDCFSVGETVHLKIKVKVKKDIDALVLGYGFKDHLGQVIFGTNTWHTGQTLQSLRADETYTFDIAFTANLGVGNYSVVVALTATDTHLSINYDWRNLAYIFSIINIDKNTFEGRCWINHDIKVSKT